MLDRDIDIHNNAAASGEESRVEGNAPAGIEVAQANQNPVFTDPATGSAVPADQAPAATPDGTRFAADQSNTVTLPEGVSIDKIVIQGKDIILVQADGTRIIITDGAVKVPTFLIGQVEVPQQTLVAALQANGINVAAGPDGTVSVVSTQSSGGNLSDGNGDIGDAGGVIGLLGNTDLVFGGATEEEVIAGIDPNDAPVFTSAAGIGSVTEILDGAPGENSTALTATGELRFTDADLQDSHSVSAIAGGAGYLGSFTPVITDSATGDGSGAVRWTFSVDDADLDYLAAGQTLTQTYTVTVTDGSGAVATQTVTVTLVGTNDAPVIISGPGAGSVTELADNAEGETVATLTTSGLLSFADVDDLDTHTVSAAPVGEGYLGTFTPVLADDSTGDNAGSIGWTFSVSDGALDFLAAGETRTQTYTVTVTDNNGATSSQTVTITLVGTNDAPIITSGPGEGSVKEYSYRGEEEWGSEGEWEGPREAAPMIHSTTGTLDFTDVDDIDTHTVSVTPNGEGYIGSFQPIITNTATGDNNGQISWTYTVQDGALDYLGAGQTRTQTYTVTVTDNNGASSSQTVTITLIGSNDRPIITGGQTSGSITELTDTDKLENNFDHPASGTLSFIDVDDVDTHTVSYYSLGSDYLGTFSVTLTDDSTGDNAGTVAWNFSVPDSAIDYLAAGQTLTQYYGVMVNDGKGGLTSQLVAVTITGTNDAPIITTGPVTESVKEIADGTEGENVDDLATNGTLAFTDVDDIDTHTVTFTPAGEKYLGDFSVSIGDDSTTDNTGTINWTFSVADADVDYLAVGETLTQTYTVTVRDNNGATSTQTVTITIVGTNDKPVITSGPDAGSVTEIADGQTGETTADLTATGSLAFSDVDLTNTHTVTHALTSVTGAAAALGTFEPTITNVATGDGTGTIGWTFKVNDGAIDYLAAGEKVTQVYTITVTDSSGATSTQTVTIEINGTNDKPVIGAGVTTGSITEIADGQTGENTADRTATGSIAFTDVDLSDVHTVNYVLSSVVGAPAALGTFTPSITNAATGDGTGTIGWTFKVNDGAIDYLAAGEKVTQVYTITVTDSSGATSTQTVTIEINGTNDKPVIGAGVTTGSITEIADGQTGENTADRTATGSIAFTDVDLSDVHTVNYVLSSVVGAPAALGTFTPSITNAATGDGTGTIGWTFKVNDGAIDYLKAGQQIVQTYTITLNDGKGGTVTKDVTITITGTNDAPVIGNATNLVVSEEGLTNGIPDTVGSTDTTNSVIASGSVTATDVDGNTLSYSFGTPTTPALTSGGVAIVWTAVGNQMIGKAGVNTIITLTMASNGSYTATLSGPIDHPNGNGENTLALTVPVNVTDGIATATQNITLTIEDDSPIRAEPEYAYLKNGAGNPVTFDLDPDTTLVNNYGADGGSVRFSPLINGDDSGLTSNGVPITYVISNGGLTLTGMAGSTSVFVMTLNPATGKYSVDMNGVVDSLSSVVFDGNSGYNFEGANKSWAGFVPTGEYLSSPVNNDSYDLLLTPKVNNVNDGTINTNANGGGVNNAFVNAGETMRVDFVRDLRNSPNGNDYGVSGNRNHLFDAHYTTNGASVGFRGTAGTVINITAFDDPDGNLVVGDGAKDTITQVAISYGGASLIVTATTTLTSYNVGGKIFSVDLNADGSVDVGGVVTGAQIGVYTGNGYNSVEYSYVSGDPFQLAGFGTSIPTTAPASFSVPIEIIDRDGDIAHSNIGVTLTASTDAIKDFSAFSSGQPFTVTSATEKHVIGSYYNDTLTGDSRDNVLYGNNGADTLTGNGGKDVLIGGHGNDILYGGDGDDMLIGGHGMDTLYGGTGADTFVLTDLNIADVIMDYSPLQGDTVDLTSLLGGLASSTDLEAGGYVQAVTSGANTLLQVDVDGGGNNWTTVATLNNFTQAVNADTIRVLFGDENHHATAQQI